jgi:glucose/arabinose dehydrogenase
MLSIAAIVLAACNGNPAPTTMVATPTLIPTLAAPVPTVIVAPVVDQELLGAINVEAACDAPAEATFRCEDAESAPRLDVQIGASTFARWSVHWENAPSLTGDETIVLRLTSSGNLAPNLYLDTSDGSRLSVPLSQFGLAQGTQILHVPLREVRDNKGNTLDFSTVNGLEIVFEWANMQGTMNLESLRIDSVWREAVTVDDDAATLAAALQMPPDFRATAIAQDLPQMTQVDFTREGNMLVSQQSGRVWLYRDTNQDGSYDERVLYTVASLDLVGLLYDPADGGVWLGSRGQLMHTLDTDGNGVADTRDIRFEGIPWGRHQNNGMAWNPDPDPFTGEPGGTWIYFGYGSVEDLEVGGEFHASILRFPRTGQGTDDLEVVSTGNRNAYDVVWADLPVNLDEPEGARTWQLFASENGPDFNDAPDEVNHIRWGHNYGYPDQFGPVAAGETDGDPYSGPVYAVKAHASADGITYIDNPAWPAEYRTLYVSLFGEVFNPAPVGHIVERITLHTVTIKNGAAPDGELTYRGEPSPFIEGLDRPLPLVTMPNGNMLVGDYATGVIYEIRYAGK